MNRPSTIVRYLHCEKYRQAFCKMRHPQSRIKKPKNRREHSKGSAGWSYSNQPTTPPIVCSVKSEAVKTKTVSNN